MTRFREKKNAKKVLILKIERDVLMEEPYVNGNVC
jgi:hypothetical protein